MNRRDDNQSGEVARTVVEFLEVAITMIVSLKGFYPSEAFERRRYMNVVVQRARHPELRDYIHSAASGLLPFIEKGLVERVAVIFFSEDNVPVEKFIFKVTINTSSAGLVEEGQLEFALRSFLIKLSVSKSLVKPLPQNCRWEVTAYLRSLPEVGSSKEGELWIPTDTKQWQKPPVITPVKSLNSEPLCLQLYLEHPNFSEPQPHAQ
ncbi:PREDICTED: DNA polymerase zeta processivity subunit isoform X2 [Camelina sativa]|uniref:DNA polymerase zeta processivity subunit isoform X2 n=1 Tax=Camelina sativa TaxID=90675 RepID=A0ABM0YA39_CAMSA|nr:PREDICTED: DNA polymerase zeta processivity subunit isoform X2 [Camelina sativa]